MSRPGSKPGKKEVRKPVSQNFAAKRLAISFQPPTLIMEYLAIDSGKLYHHKMRLDSIMRKPNCSRIDVLNYVKNKHNLYFVHGRIKDAQLLKFLDKIIAKTPKPKPDLHRIQEQQQSPQNYLQSSYNQDGDFDYLNDDEYEEDYEDYEEPEDKPAAKVEGKVEAKVETKMESRKEPSKLETMFNKNTFMTYCQEYEDSNEQEEGGAEWDLDMEGSADFV